MYGMFRIICNSCEKCKSFLKKFFLSRKIDKNLVFVLCIWYDMGTLPGLDTVDPQEIKPC